MAINLGSAYGKVGLDASGVKSGVATATANLKQLGALGAKIGSSMQILGAGLTLGLTAPIVAFGVSAVKSAMEAEDAMAELNAVLASTQGVAGLTAKELTDMATALERVTKFSDEEIIAGESMLLTFTQIGKDIFPMATEATLNMAEKFGSVEQAAVQLGKAMNDPISGVTALRRVGVMLSDQQEQQIKDFMAVGDIASAQMIILKELETEFGGLAKAAGETTSGRFAQFTNAVDNLKEALGTAFLPMLAKAAQALTRLVNAFVELPPGVQKGIIIFGTLGAAMLALIGPMLVFVGTIISSVSGIVTIVGTLGTAGVSMAAISGALAGVLEVIFAIGLTLATVVLPILLIIGTLALLYLAFKTNFGGIRTAAEQLWFILKWGFQQMWDNLMTWAEEGMTSIRESMQAGAEQIQLDLSGLTNWLETAWRNTMDFMARMAAWGRNAIFSVFRVDWGALGRSIINGIINGFLSGVVSLVAAAKKAAQAVLDTFSSTLDMNSPSMEMFKLGDLAGQGFVLGMARGIDPRALARMVARPVQQMSSSQQQQNIMNISGGLTIQQTQGLIAQAKEEIFGAFDMMLAGSS